MSEYLVLIFVLAFCSYCEMTQYLNEKSFKIYNIQSCKYSFTNNVKKQTNLINFVFLFLIMLIIFMFRDVSVGTDTSNYKDIFDYITFHNYKFGSEPVFTVLVLFSKLLNLPFEFLLMLIGILLIFSLCKISLNYSPFPCMSMFLMVCLGVYFIGFNIARQFMALGFFILAFKCIEKKRLFEYLLYCVLMILCHNSAIILLPLYLINYVKFNKTTLILLGCITFIGAFSIEYIVKIICKLISRDYYTTYILNGNFSGSTSVVHLFYNIGLIVLLLLFFYFKKHIRTKDSRVYDLLLKIFALGVAIRTIGTMSVFSVMLNRITWYFIWPVSLLIPFTIKYFPLKSFNKLYMQALLLAGFAYFYLTIVISGQGQVVPYSFVFGDESLTSLILKLLIESLSIYLIINNSSTLLKKGVNYDTKNYSLCVGRR